MAGDNFDPFKKTDESDEQHRHRLEEAVLSEDWNLRFQAGAAEVSALDDALADQQDPDRILDLTIERQESLTRSLGSGCVSLWQRDVTTERQQFEADFGQTLY